MKSIFTEIPRQYTIETMSPGPNKEGTPLTLAEQMAKALLGSRESGTGWNRRTQSKFAEQMKLIDLRNSQAGSSITDQTSDSPSD